MARAWWKAVARFIEPQLNSIYAQLPATTCSRRGLCCLLLPPVAPAEAVVWLGRVWAGQVYRRKAVVMGLVGRFLCNAWMPTRCLWARAGRCAIYPHRFFSCRAYGLWSETAYEARRALALERQQQVLQAWEGLGVRLPERVVQERIGGYCRRVRPVGEGISDRRLEELEGEVWGLGEGEWWWVRAGGWGGDLGQGVAFEALGHTRALELKVEITRALVEGRGARARRLLSQALEVAGDWAMTN